MKLDTVAIKKLGKLARLDLTDEQVQEYAKQLTSILDYAEQLNEVDTDSIDATTQIVNANESVLREDTVDACTQDVLNNLMQSVPNLQDDFIKVPKVL